MKNDPEVQHQLDKVLKEAYEKAYGEVLLDLDSPEEIESDDVPMVDEPAPGMEDEVHHSPELHDHQKLLATCGKQAYPQSALEF